LTFLVFFFFEFCRSSQSHVATQLHNAQLEIQRLSNLLEKEILRAGQQKSKLEDEIRSLKRESKFQNLPCILSPPQRRQSQAAAAIATAPSAPRDHGHYVIGLTGDSLDNAVSVFSCLGATIVDVDEVSVKLCSGSLAGEVSSKNFVEILAKTMTVEANKALHDAKTHVVVFCASKLFESSLSCNMVVLVTASLERTAESEMATLVLENNVSTLQTQLTRLWSLIPQPHSSAFGKTCRGRLTAVDATLPSCDLFDGADILFGRSELCSVQIADLTVSHEHCRVFVKNEQIWLEDLSTHGTYVNRQKIGHKLRVRLEHGDAVWLSKVALKSKTAPCAFVVHLCDKVETRLLQFPSQFVTRSSETPKWIEKKSTHQPEKHFRLNVRTGETKIV
jgi:hypothetical protein